MENEKGITKYFGANLAELISDKIIEVYKDFKKVEYIAIIEGNCLNLSYTQRVELHADQLYVHLPKDFEKAIKILMAILGEENQNETGMFKEFYWILPIGKFVEKYGLEHLDASIAALEEITKRNTGEYAIRPFIRKYPKEMIAVMKNGLHQIIFI